MALLGTLAEFQVDDILMLLSGTAKTGVLGVEGGERTGRVWVDAGRIVGAELDDHHEPADVLFELLRLADGKFAFEAGAMPAPPAAAGVVDAGLASVAPMPAAEAGAVEASARMARVTASRSTVASTDDLVRQLSSLRSR